MPEQQHNAPTPGGAENTLAPGDGANVPGDESAPSNGTPTLDPKAIRQEGFGDGYGKGLDKGGQRRDKAWGDVLSQFDLPTSPDELREALAARRKGAGNGAGDTPAKVEETEQYQDLAQRFVALEKKYTTLERANADAEKRADQARLDKFRRAAAAKGIAAEALEYFVPKHEQRIKMTDAGDLVVLSQMEDGTLVAAGEKLEDFLDSVIESSPFLVASSAKKGAGSQPRSVTPSPKIQRGDAPKNFDVTPLSERLRQR